MSNTSNVNSHDGDVGFVADNNDNDDDDDDDSFCDHEGNDDNNGRDVAADDDDNDDQSDEEADDYYQNQQDRERSHDIFEQPIVFLGCVDQQIRAPQISDDNDDNHD